jgi:hypothetical protein
MINKNFNFKRGDKAQIGRIAGLNTAEISQALSTTTNLETAQKIKDAALALGYDLNIRVKRVIVEIESAVE